MLERKVLHVKRYPLHQVARIFCHAGKTLRAPRVKPWHPEQVQTWLRRAPAVEARVAAAIENDGLDPGKVRPEVDTPDDASDILRAQGPVR